MGQEIELYYKPWTLFAVMQSLGLLLFISGMIYRFSFYFKGRRKSLYKKPDYLLMLKAIWRYVFLQKQLAQQNILRWFAHISIFYGFIGLLMLSAIAVALETVIPADSSFSRYMLHGQGHNYYKAAGDFFGLIMLLGLLIAFVRRYIVKDSQLYTDSTDSIALIILLTLVITGFLLEAMRISLLPPSPELQYSFIGYNLAVIFRGISGIPSLATALWLFHSALNAALFAYIPHSKFLHIINSPLEIALNVSEERMRGDLYI